MKSQQQAFLEHIGLLIPKLFDAIRLGNVKSEYVLGDRIIGQRQVRLKLVAEVVDPGSNPLATHSQMRKAQLQPLESAKPPGRSASASQPIPPNQSDSPNQSDRRQQTDTINHTKPATVRRGSRRKHPLSR